MSEILLAAAVQEFSGIYPHREIRPFQAILAVLRLARNPQDTKQVALIETALAGRSQAKIFQRFVASANGRAIVRERRSLARTLDDHDRLRALPQNSFGQHYLAFMEQEGFSAQGLMDATPAMTELLSKMPEAVRLFSDYTQRGSHDLYHILGGYGRDELGEICVLAMGYEQLKIRGYKVISAIGSLVVFRQLRRMRAGSQGVFAAVAEAAKIGRQAGWIPGLDMEAALGEDLDALRGRLNIRPPQRYEAVIARVKSKTGWTGGPFLALSH